MKKFTRHNDWPVSHEIRADLWKVLCHSKDFDSNKLLYETQLEELTKSGGEFSTNFPPHSTLLGSLFAVRTLRPAFLAMDGIVVHDHG